MRKTLMTEAEKSRLIDQIFSAAGWDLEERRQAKTARYARVTVELPVETPEDGPAWHPKKRTAEDISIEAMDRG